MAEIAPNDSLRKRMRNAQVVLVILMLIPALVAIYMMWQYSQSYHRIVEQISNISELRPIIQTELLEEMMDVVTGRKHFEDGSQYEIIEGLQERLEDLIDSGMTSKIELEVSRRLLYTIKSYVDNLGQADTVDEQFAYSDEINNMSALFLDMLQEAMNTEIIEAAKVSRQMQDSINQALLLEFVLVMVSLAFAVVGQRSLSKTIQVPLDRLERFAKRVASGELTVRAKEPDVEELRSLTVSLNTMAYKLEKLLDERQKEQDALKKSELRALQAQITPHFLYNTLDAIVWLAEAGETQQVIDITGALSNFFRISLNNGRDWVSIAEEWQHVEGYFIIQKIRYRDILQYELAIDEELKAFQIVKLLIQPLVENSIYHGIKNKRNGGIVRVEARKNGEKMKVTIADNGAGMRAEQLEKIQRALMVSESTEAEMGYGLYSVDKRIKLYYGQSEGLFIASVPGEGTKVGFSVPLMPRMM